MGEVYSHALLNISATGAEDGDGGLFHGDFLPSQHPCILPVPTSNPAIPPNSTICFILDNWDSQIEDASLANRGWVLQERILSPRVLHFAKDQMYWQCWEAQLGEFHFPLTINQYNFKWGHCEIRKNERDAGYLNYDWWILVQRYSMCLLTVGEDKLPAISGLATRFCRQLQLETGDYLAGLWRPTLARDLLWGVKLSDGVAHMPGRAPSWSW